MTRTLGASPAGSSRWWAGGLRRARGGVVVGTHRDRCGVGRLDRSAQGSAALFEGQPGFLGAPAAVAGGLLLAVIANLLETPLLLVVVVISAVGGAAAMGAGIALLLGWAPLDGLAWDASGWCLGAGAVSTVLTATIAAVAAAFQLDHDPRSRRRGAGGDRPPPALSDPPAHAVQLPGTAAVPRRPVSGHGRRPTPSSFRARPPSHAGQFPGTAAGHAGLFPPPAPARARRR